MRARGLEWLVVGAACFAGGCGGGAFQGAELAPARAAPALESWASGDVAFRLADQHGKVALVAFGYTSCPAVCPGTLARARSLLARLGPDASEVVVGYVSVDPERDRPARLAGWVRSFDPRFVPLHLGGVTFERTLSAWGVRAERHYAPDGSYSVAHTADVFLVDRAGRLRVRHRYDASVDALEADVRRLLAEAAP